MVEGVGSRRLKYGVGISFFNSVLKCGLYVFILYLHVYGSSSCALCIVRS